MHTVDRQLLERARTQDAEALAEIYDAFAGPIYGYLYRYLGDAHQAEDLTSEVFLRLLQALNTSRAPRDNLQGWLYRVAHNLAMDWFRHNRNHSGSALDEKLPSEGDPPLAVLEKQQTQDRLRAAIRELTAEQQQVILLRFGEGWSIAEVSRLMGKKQGAIKILQHRAITRLRKLLTSKGYWV